MTRLTNHRMTHSGFGSKNFIKIGFLLITITNTTISRLRRVLPGAVRQIPIRRRHGISLKSLTRY